MSNDLIGRALYYYIGTKANAPDSTDKNLLPGHRAFFTDTVEKCEWNGTDWEVIGINGARITSDVGAIPTISNSWIVAAEAASDVVSRSSGSTVTATNIPRIEGANTPSNRRRISLKATASIDSTVTDWIIVINAADELTAKPTFDAALDTAAGKSILRYGTTMSTSNDQPVVTLGANDDAVISLDVDITSLFVVPVSAGTFAGKAILDIKLQEAA